MTSHDTTRILGELSRGDSGAADRLLPLVYDELRRLAAAYLRQERADHTLQPTALVHEAYLKLVNQERADWQNRAHFIAVAAEAIRRILVDHARVRNAAKRGGGEWQRVTLSGVHLFQRDDREIDLLALDDALARLEQLHERQGRVVQLRFFGGLSERETAEVLGVSRTTVASDWTVARAWLSRELSGGTAA